MLEEKRMLLLHLSQDLSKAPVRRHIERSPLAPKTLGAALVRTCQPAAVRLGQAPELGLWRLEVLPQPRCEAEQGFSSGECWVFAPFPHHTDFSGEEKNSVERLLL